MRIRVLLLVIVAVLAGAVPARAEEDLPAIERLTLELETMRRHVDGTVAGPFTVEARAARLEALSPDLVTLLSELRATATDNLSELVARELAIDIVDSAVDPRRVPGVAFGLDTHEDVTLLDRLARVWTVAVARAAEVAEVVTHDELRTCPIRGPHFFTDTWGAPRPGGRTHSGVDMNSLRGMKLYAMEDGRIIQMNWHRAGGRTLYLLGETTGDVYYYAHLDGYAPNITRGSVVKAGDHVGWVGQTGNAAGPHLHLGWMPGAGEVDFGGLENPYLLVAGLCR